ncbi:CvpA family protein [Patescibacteria group bacterium]|nr:CvpA family protein [Patescibacteria group bacterium]
MPQFITSNYIDLIIVIILIYYLTEAFRHGFWVILVDFISFFGSLILSLRFYKYASSLLKANFVISLSMANAVGYVILAILFETLLSFVSAIILYKLPQRFKKHRINKFLGIIPGLGEGLIIIAFILTLIMSLPIKPNLKEDIIESKIGSIILDKTSIFEKSINEVFGGVINDSLTYFTVNPDSKDTISLDVTSFNLIVDEKAESEMFLLINSERKKLAIPELKWNNGTLPISRSFAKDMWTRKYFSHFSPEGKNVGDRLNAGNIEYTFAGENLALAPTTKTAHIGLMNSKGHRENILESRFNSVSIGVIDNGIYGKIFVQVFTD